MTPDPAELEDALRECEKDEASYERGLRVRDERIAELEEALRVHRRCWSMTDPDPQEVDLTQLSRAELEGEVERSWRAIRQVETELTEHGVAITYPLADAVGAALDSLRREDPSRLTPAEARILLGDITGVVDETEALALHDRAKAKLRALGNAASGTSGASPL